MRAVLVGLGMVADTHLAAIAATGGKVTLHGVMARRRERAEAFATKAGETLAAAPRVYGEVAEIAADPQVDAVILCTPPDVRMELIAPLAEAGKPILLEKPVERSLEGAQEVVACCEAAGVPLGMVFQHRMRANSLRAAEIVASGTLGALAVVETHIPWWRPQSYYDEAGRGTYARDGGGVLLTQAIHTLELMLSLAGPVSRVQAITRTSQLHEMEAEDFVSAGLDFSNGAVGSIMASTASFPGGSELVALHGSEGSLRLVGKTLEVVWRDGRREALGEQGGSGGGADPMAFTHSWHQAVIEDFADALNAGRPPLVTGRQALHVHSVIDAMVASSRSGRAVDLAG